MTEPNIVPEDADSAMPVISSRRKPLRANRNRARGVGCVDQRPRCRWSPGAGGRTRGRQPQLQPARLTVDLPAPTALEPIEVHIRAQHARRRLRLVEAVLVQRGVRVARVSAPFLRRGPQPDGHVWSPPVQMPPWHGRRDSTLRISSTIGEFAGRLTIARAQRDSNRPRRFDGIPSAAKPPHGQRLLLEMRGDRRRVQVTPGI